MIKVASYVRHTAEFVEDIGNDVIINRTKNDLKKRNEDHSYKKGYKPFGPMRVRSGLSGDDLLQNMYTVICEQALIRIPHFMNPSVNATRNRSYHRYYRRRR